MRNYSFCNTIRWSDHFQTVFPGTTIFYIPVTSSNPEFSYGKPAGKTPVSRSYKGLIPLATFTPIKTTIVAHLLKRVLFNIHFVLLIAKGAIRSQGVNV